MRFFQANFLQLFFFYLRKREESIVNDTVKVFPV